MRKYYFEGKLFRNSIFFKLKLLFIVFITILTLLSIIVIVSTELSVKRDFISRVHFFVSNAPDAVEKEDILQKCTSLDLTAVLDQKIISDTINSSKEIVEIPNPHAPLVNFYVLKNMFDDVIIIETYGEKVLLKDNKSHAIMYASAIGFLIVLYLLLFILYSTIKKSLLPLRGLNQAIKKFGDGDMNIDTSSDKADEIGEISNQFNSAVKKIRELTQAKEAFLAGAAHELKTPLAKAIIAAHLLDDSKQKDALLDIFDYQKNLIDDMLSLNGFELINSEENQCQINIKEFLQEILEVYILPEPKSIKIMGDDITIASNPRLLKIILLNLVQNGLKFSEDGKVSIYLSNGKIEVATKGEALSEPVWKYFEPFFKENSTRNRMGTGLGLYISKKAADSIGSCLEYSYKDGNNVFSVNIKC